MQIHMKLRNPPNSELALRRIVVEPFKDHPPQSTRQTRGAAGWLMNKPSSAQVIFSALNAETLFPL